MTFRSFTTPNGIKFSPYKGDGYRSVTGGIEFLIERDAQLDFGIIAKRNGKPLVLSGIPMSMYWGRTRKVCADWADGILKKYGDGK